MKLYIWNFIGILSALTLLIGCGEGPKNEAEATAVQSWEMNALPNTQATLDAVIEASTLKSCPHSQYFLAGDNFSWNIVGGGANMSTLDVVEIRENCTFRSYQCGTLGYIISGGENFGSGIVNVMLLGHLFPKDSCYRLGENVCSYVQDGAGELRLDCQLLTPLKGPFL